MDGLSFARTVDRALVHRRNLSEVFLTDVREVAEDEFAAAAQLPVAHPHYTGLTGSSRFPDAMVLLECCRQAETCAAHLVHGIEQGTSFVLRNWTMALVPDAPSPGPGPLDLVMTARTRDPYLVAGTLRGLTYEFGMWVSGVRLGEVRMQVGYVARDAYLVMRGKGRTGPLPSSRTQPPVSTGRLVEPALAGRTNRDDTLLLDLQTRAGGVGAVLRVPVDNISFFDHPQDHVPGMVLVEAARQLAVATAAGCGRMVGMDASFSAYAELDAPITLTAVPREGGWTEVVFHQGGKRICRVSVELAEEMRP
ncbi:AfsA-related hotdog domain-containing protein [Saccharothrix sp. Mg75]|uniref:AfsA-related hotdog domain-containing protein n=1 Tax=Saccharothrix sp. Mg75 TaxID=3445357 RepID=UPI003EEBDA40